MVFAIILLYLIHLEMILISDIQHLHNFPYLIHIVNIFYLLIKIFSDFLY